VEMSDRYLYPALLACIAEARRPRAAEIKKVVRRMRAEIRPESFTSRSARRRVTMLALAALGIAISKRDQRVSGRGG